MHKNQIATLTLPEKYLLQVRAILQAELPHAEVWAYGSRVHVLMVIITRPAILIWWYVSPII
ncbi:MAG: hypothetical protein ACRCWB_09735 [Enterovibrio sp.]